MNNIRVTVNIPPNQYMYLERAKSQLGYSSMSEFVRHIIADYAQREAKLDPDYEQNDNVYVDPSILARSMEV